MRRALCFMALVLAGCPLPEDAFVVSGRVTQAHTGGSEVRLLRSRFASETRCDVFEPLEVTQTDADGRYAFTVIRQQVTAGVTGRRFFAVEADVEGGTFTQRFWFPDADLDLGETGETIDGTRRFIEQRLDGRLAWRTATPGGPANSPDRPFEARQVYGQREWRTVPIDSLGRFDVVPIESRFEAPWTRFDRATQQVPAGRGAKCPFVDVVPCPLTDGRFEPYVFPPDTPALILNFGHETDTSRLGFHGLVLQRPAVKARFDFNFFVDYTQWNPMIPARLDPDLFARESDHCDEPGVFINSGSGGGVSPVIFRVRFEDAEGLTVPIVSLSEVTVR